MELNGDQPQISVDPGDVIQAQQVQLGRMLQEMVMQAALITQLTREKADLVKQCSLLMGHPQPGVTSDSPVVTDEEPMRA